MLRFAVELDRSEALEQFLEEDAQGQPGQRRSDTEVRSEPERDLALRASARDVELVRIGELGLVPVGRPDPGDDSPRAGTVPPPIRVSFTAYRMKLQAADVQRSPSSARFGTSDGSACAFANCSGRSMSAWTVPETVCGVVTLAPRRML